MKVAFLRGSALDPVPPGATKQQGVRYLDIREGDTLAIDLAPTIEAEIFLKERKRTRPKAELKSVLAEVLPTRLAHALTENVPHHEAARRVCESRRP